MFFIIIPTALNFDTCPVPASDGGNDLWRGHQKVPGLTACIDNGFVGVPDPQAEDVVTQILPDILGRVQLGCIRWQRQQNDVVWDDQARGLVPTCGVEHEQGNRAGTDALTDLGQMGVHGLDIDAGHDHGRPGAAGGADGAEQIGPGKPPVTLEPGTCATLRPQASHSALLANARFILEPDLDRTASTGRWDRGACLSGEAFLEGFLRGKVALRVQRTSGDVAEIKRLQQLADAAFVKADAETRLDPIPQVGAAPADNTVLLGIRTVLNPALQFAHLRRRQAELAARARSVNQASHAVPVVAVHPVTQTLALHAACLGRQLPRMIIQHHRNSQHPPRLPWVLRARRLGTKLASGQVITGNPEQSQCLPRESTVSRIDSQPAAFENPQRVKSSGGWYKRVLRDSNTRRCLFRKAYGRVVSISYRFLRQRFGRAPRCTLWR